MDVSENIVGTLRAEMSSHAPIILIYDARGNGGVKYRPPLQEITKAESQITRQ
jgi:hypothetical protein